MRIEYKHIKIEKMRTFIEICVYLKQSDRYTQTNFHIKHEKVAKFEHYDKAELSYRMYPKQQKPHDT